MNETPFTFSNEQIEFLNLSLYEMCACRNAVVQFYSDKRHDNRLEDYMTPMMSVTAVIDHYSMGYTA